MLPRTLEDGCLSLMEPYIIIMFLAFAGFIIGFLPFGLIESQWPLLFGGPAPSLQPATASYHTHLDSSRFARP